MMATVYATLHLQGLLHLEPLDLARVQIMIGFIRRTASVFTGVFGLFNVNRQVENEVLLAS